MACPNFPAVFVPFVNVAYVSAPNSAGDRLVVGELVGDINGILAIGANLPLAGARNEMYCNAQVQLGPKNTYANVYVPTAAERSGDFSPFAELLLDPLANRQPFPAGRIPLSRLGGTYAFRIGSQTASLQCAGSSPSPKLLRVEGRTELVGDFVIVCTGGAPTPLQKTIPSADVSVSINGTITSRLLGAPNWSEALLLVDDPAPTSQIVCASSNGVCGLIGTGTANGFPQDPNVFQGQQTQPNMLTFSGIPLNPPGPSGARTFRITNVRVDAQSLGSGPALNRNAVPMLVTLTASPAIVLTGSTQTVGSVRKALTVTSKAAAAGPRGLAQFTLNYAEAFASAFKMRSGNLFLSPDISPSPGNQDAPAQSLPGSETGFYSGYFPSLSRGDLRIAGLADNGTRLYAQLSNVPSGVTVSTNAVANLLVGNTSSGTVRLITGSPSFSPLGTSDATVNLARDSSGVVTAVFEVLNSDPLQMESVDIPFFFSFTAGTPALTSAVVTAGLAPAADSAVFPRFTSAISLKITARSGAVGQDGILRPVVNRLF
jgi:hypothetical protein